MPNGYRQPIGFLAFDNNDVFHATRGTCLLSSVFNLQVDGRISGQGLFLYDNKIDSFRTSLAFYCTRLLPNRSWGNSSDVYLARMISK